MNSTIEEMRQARERIERARNTTIHLRTEKPLTEAQKRELGEWIGSRFVLSGRVEVEVL